jgi:hypothetical protein
MTPVSRIAIALACAAGSVVVSAQEPKPVPGDSVRVSVAGCAKGYIFTAGRPSEDQGGSAVPDGTRLRMNGPKKLIAEIRGNEGSRIEITGLMKKGQVGPEGIDLGRGVRVRPGIGGPSTPLGGSLGVGAPAANQIMIDVEGWRHVAGECPR